MHKHRGTPTRHAPYRSAYAYIYRANTHGNRPRGPLRVRVDIGRDKPSSHFIIASKPIVDYATVKVGDYCMASAEDPCVNRRRLSLLRVARLCRQYDWPAGIRVAAVATSPAASPATGDDAESSSNVEALGGLLWQQHYMLRILPGT